MNLSVDMGAVLEQAKQCLLQNDSASARVLLDEALPHAPDDPSALHLSGLAFAGIGDFAAARQSLARACNLNPERPVYRRDLTAVLLRLGDSFLHALQLNEAAEALQACLAIDPANTRAMLALTDVFALSGRRHEALVQREAVLAISPGDASARISFIQAIFHFGDLPRAIAESRACIDAGAATPEMHSEYLHMLQHDPAQSRESLREESARWASLYAPRSAIVAVRSARGAAGKVRVGYLSSEFCGSPFRHFFLPILRNHARADFEIVSYFTRAATDRHTPTFRALADTWRDAAEWPLEKLDAQIRQDEIDVLIDTSGHYHEHRLQLFPRRPARAQATFPNYPGTTGVPGVDYIFTDRWVCPSGCESQYSEEGRFIPSGYIAWDPPLEPPIPEPAGGPVTFGYFQRPSKSNPAVWDAVAAVLQKCPESILLVHYSSTELDEPSSEPCQRIRAELMARGIPGDRVRFRGALPLAGHLALLGQADIALDSFPYNGQTTTCECLWMGVPVVTMVGASHVARVGYEILDRVGLGCLAAFSPADYVRKVVALAEDRDRLTALRQGLRGMMRASPLMDGARLAQTMEQNYIDLLGE